MIVWEEFASSNVAVVNCAHEVCCMITHSQAPFGGIPFIAVGDFRQVAPITRGQGRTPTILASVKRSHLWPRFKHLTLHHSHRGASDPEYTSFVDFVGEDSDHNTVSLNILDAVQCVDEAIDFLFPPAILQQPLLCLKRSFLSPKNVDVDEFNSKILDSLPTDERTLIPIITDYLFVTFSIRFVLQRRLYQRRDPDC